MPTIHLLDKRVAELIAAGEVVERPASIVKELLENSLDAGATTVTLEIRGGGISYIRITDNGCGISREDIPRAFMRHATSKVRTEEDLAGIATLGFRGEAMASIAAMSKVELTTKPHDDIEGTTCRVEGGDMLDSYPVGCPSGTTIIVKDVFYNTPARMKFLKRDISEGNSVAQIVEKCALASPHVSFRFIRDNATKFQTSGSGDLLAVIRAIYGKELSSAMIPVDYTHENKIRVTGYVTHPDKARASRTYQNFFINTRYVRTKTGSAALQEAYKNKIMIGKFPGCVLNLEMDVRTVDVNVHPAKIEVRFADEKPVFHAVYFAVQSAIGKLDAPLAPKLQRQIQRPLDAVSMHELPRTEPLPKQERMSLSDFKAVFGGSEQQSISRPVQLNSPSLDIAVDDDWAVTKTVTPYSGAVSDKISPAVPAKIENDATKTEKIATYISEAPVPFKQEAFSEDVFAQDEPVEAASVAVEVAEAGDIRVIGEALSTYILLQQDEDLMLVDKHAAHERILYEQLKESIRYGTRQILLTPHTVTLSREEYGALSEELERLTELGFLVEDFGDCTVIVREIPIELGQRDVEAIISEIATNMIAGRRDLTPEVLDRLYFSIACRSAIKGGDKNHIIELEEIVKALQNHPEITHCPHGRPVVVRLGKYEIEKMFGRV